MLFLLEAPADVAGVEATLSSTTPDLRLLRLGGGFTGCEGALEGPAACWDCAVAKVDVVEAASDSLELDAADDNSELSGDTALLLPPVALKLISQVHPTGQTRAW